MKKNKHPVSYDRKATVTQINRCCNSAVQKSISETQHMDLIPWSGWATAAEGHNKVHSCQRNTSWVLFKCCSWLENRSWLCAVVCLPISSRIMHHVTKTTWNWFHRHVREFSGLHSQKILIHQCSPAKVLVGWLNIIWNSLPSHISSNFFNFNWQSEIHIQVIAQCAKMFRLPFFNLHTTTSMAFVCTIESERVRCYPHIPTTHLILPLFVTEGFSPFFLQRGRPTRHTNQFISSIPALQSIPLICNR